MEKIHKYARIIRNNWKKSTLGAIVAYYGAAKLKEKYEINLLMRAACEEAVTFGDELIPMDRNPKLITVILNPVANKRKAKQDYEKYCEPLLHLAGLQVDLIQTTSEGNAKEVVETLRGTEAIIVAGGDGTLSETITGLLRRSDNANQFPVGILPLGRTNTLGNLLFPGGKGVEKVKQLIEASMAIIKGTTTWKDAMKIEPILTADEEPTKPIYALSSVEWGAFKDTLALKDKYWLYGSLREYAAFVFNGYKESLSWKCTGTLRYTKPCVGCGNCIEKKSIARRKWNFLIPQTNAATEKLAENPECSQINELCFKTADFRIHSANKDNTKSDVPSLRIKLGKNKYSYTQFVSEGWARLNGEADTATVIEARTVELLPKDLKDNDRIEIDKEDFDAKPVKVTILPKVVKLFCPTYYEYKN